MKKHSGNLLRFGLGGLFAFGALNAFGGGYYGLSGAKDVPLEWLRGTPFHDYTVPSAILFGVVGGTLTAAAIAVFARARHARELGLAAALVLLGWITVQVALIGYVSWMQPVTFLFAVTVGALSAMLPSARQPQAQRRLAPQH